MVATEKTILQTDYLMLPTQRLTAYGDILTHPLQIRHINPSYFFQASTRRFHIAPETLAFNNDVLKGSTADLRAESFENG